MMQAKTETTCQICSSSTGKIIAAREMMYGTREPFTYFECGDCGCLQLLNVPADLSPYYPKHYYSFSMPRFIPKRSTLRQALNEFRNAGCIFGHNPLSWLLTIVRPGPDFSWLSQLLRPTGIRTMRAKILDVGCGAGDLLRDMADGGFSNLVGVDPFATSRSDDRARLRIVATTLDNLHETDFDMVMSHHSLEHMADQISMLRHMHRVLKPGGVCLVRIPVASSEVWRRYRENWVELDPPRHLVIHTQKSFKIAAESVGFHLEACEYDESAFGYWGSELYLADVPLHDPETQKHRIPSDYFKSGQIDEFARLARVANEKHYGGRAAFYLRKH